eukprot:32669-Rhodomonas_salina.1
MLRQYHIAHSSTIRYASTACRRELRASAAKSKTITRCGGTAGTGIAFDFEPAANLPLPQSRPPSPLAPVGGRGGEREREKREERERGGEGKE